MINIIIGKKIKQNYTGNILGVDKSAYYLIEEGYRDFISVGDFDSCTSEEFQIINNNSHVLKHSSIKDYSDLELAIRYAIDELGENEIIIHNIYAGNRLDHLYANLLLLQIGIEKNVDISLVGDNNKAYVIKPGKHHICKNNHKYVSFFAVDLVKGLTLNNFKYGLNNETLSTNNPLCVSNEILNEYGIVEFTEGLLLVIQSND